jgi:hypothetical protein
MPVRLTWLLDGSRFIQRQRNSDRGGFLMKPVEMECSIGLDRLATWNEVLCAMSGSSPGGIALVGERDAFREEDSDFNGGVGNLSEDTLWLALVREMPDSKSN